MATLTETEIKKISKLQRHEAVTRLAGHFTWPEFGDARRPSIQRHFHQHFVYDVALFAWTRGFPWKDVIRAATMVKHVFPRLTGLDVAGQLTLLHDTQTQWMSNLMPLHQSQLSWYLVDTCVGSQRLLAAVADTAANASTERGHLEVQVPPRPLPLAQGMALEGMELKRHQAELITTLGHTEHQLQAPRDALRLVLNVSTLLDAEGMTLGEVELKRHQAELTAALGHTEHRLQALRDAPRLGGSAELNGSAPLDAEGVQEWARAAARQVASSLRQEVTLVAELLELKLQCAVSTTRESRSPAVSPQTTVKQTRQAQVKKARRK